LIITKRLFPLCLTFFSNIYRSYDRRRKKEKLEEIENLKFLLKFHSQNRVINTDKKFIEYVDEILDEINRIENELNNAEQS